jgi:CHAD domain-containing protein
MQFPRNQAVITSVRNALITNLKEALESLSTSKNMRVEGFKNARKAVKRARGALRLVEQGLTGKWLAREEDILKEVSRVFRDVRDTLVAEELFDRVIGHFKEEHPSKKFESVRGRLSQVSKEVAEKACSDEKKIKQTIAEIQIALERVDELEIKGDPWKAIREGIRDTYRSSVDAFEDSCETRSEASYIEWRQSVKFLRVQLEYLKEFVTKEGEEVNGKLHRLSDLLGDYQDIAMLRDIVKEDKNSYGEKDLVKTTLDLFEERMKQVAKEARKLGEELFEPSPKVFLATLFDQKVIASHTVSHAEAS